MGGISAGIQVANELFQMDECQRTIQIDATNDLSWLNKQAMLHSLELTYPE